MTDIDCLNRPFRATEHTGHVTGAAADTQPGGNLGFGLVASVMQSVRSRGLQTPKPAGRVTNASHVGLWPQPSRPATAGGAAAGP